MVVQAGAGMLPFLVYLDMVRVTLAWCLTSTNFDLIRTKGGTLVSHGDISVGDLTSLLLYTVYVGNGLQMLTLVVFTANF